jgi:histone acetyltransferase (RNA polymerase elongator complex component)
MIIPFFIPHSGCPHQCVFCNQKNITGQTKPVDPSAVPQKIADYLANNSSDKTTHVAFYGGSFTALPFETQKAYLAAVQPFIHTGHIAGIRLSTRPDCITKEILSLLNEYHVTTIELGVPSMDDVVLTRSGRGHTATDTVNAVSLIKSHGFQIGLQLMPGLPGDSADSFMKTIRRVIDLKPHFVRIYPALVIKDTALEDLYTSGRYMPLSLDEAVLLCREALERFELAGIDVIRIGLQPTEELEKPGTIIAGPYHPAFRQLVESSILLDKMRSALRMRMEEVWGQTLKLTY